MQPDACGLFSRKVPHMSLMISIHTSTWKGIVEAWHEEGRWSVKSGECGEVNLQTVITTFEKLRMGR